MKTLYFIAMMIGLHMSVIIKPIQAQTTQNKLNQIELMKQFLGTWQAQMGKDTVQVDEFTAFGSGIVGTIKNITKGKVISSTKELWGYDQKNDKIIFAMLWESSPEISLWAYWFTSKNTCEGVSYQDLSNPEKAILKYKMVIKSSDSYVLTMLQNNKPVAESTFKRVKK
ncbi:MAG: hypothetical protein WCP85_17005 [Mariniphaga sp.]